MLFANLLKCGNGLSQGVCDLHLVLEVQVCSWSAHRSSKHSQCKLDPFQLARGARLWVQKPGFDRNRHFCERLAKDFLHFMIGHHVEVLIATRQKSTPEDVALRILTVGAAPKPPRPACSIPAGPASMSAPTP